MATVVTGDAAPAPRTGLVALADQAAGGRIRIVDFGTDFAGVPRELWSWRPDGVTGWGRPTDVRLARHPRWGDVVVAPDSFGAVVVADRRGRVRAALDLGGAANPHAAELLPDGALAVASSTAGRVDVFDPAGGSPAGSVDLEGAHGVVWDGGARMLWALGTNEMLALRPESGRWLLASVVPLPGAGGHDLVTDPDGVALWATTETSVHRFDRATGRWAPAPPEADLARVKAIDLDPASRTMVLARPEPGRDPEWVTGVVEFPFAGRSVRVGGDVYKVRHWGRR